MAESKITELLNQIKSAVYGKDVRAAIHDSIRQCYDDGKAGSIDITAREFCEELKKGKANKEEVDVERKRINELVTNPMKIGEYTQGNLVFYAHPENLHEESDIDDTYNYEGTQGSHVMPAFKQFDIGPLNFAKKNAEDKVKITKSGLYLVALRLSLDGTGAVDIDVLINGETQVAQTQTLPIHSSCVETRILNFICTMNEGDTLAFYCTPQADTRSEVPVRGVACYALDWEGKTQISDYSGYVSELKELRVGPDGESYSTAGEAVRQRYKALEKEIESLRKAIMKNQEAVTITYKDGANETAFSDVVKKVIKGENTPVYTAPAREGYTFSKWNPTIAEKATADATYTAVWQKNDGGGQEPESVVSDSAVIPDMHNTGIEDGVTLKELTTSDTSGATRIQITQSVANNLCNSDGVIENYHFNGIYVDFNKDITQTAKFKNCKFTGDDSMSYAVALSTYGADKGVTFENCEFSHYKAAVASGLWKAVFDKCYVHDMMQDAYKINHSEIYLKNCYTRSLGLDSTSHADGVQIENNTVDVTAHIYNCRFDQPITSGNTENSSIFAKCKDNNIILDVQKCYATGGNYTIYALDGSTAKVTGKIESTVGCSYRYGTTNISDNVEQDVAAADKLMVGTVGNGKVYAVNYTNAERTLRIVTDVGEKTVVIPKCPTYAENHTQAFSEYPFDVAVDYPSGATWVKCYDGETLIRTQKL